MTDNQRRENDLVIPRRDLILRGFVAIGLIALALLLLMAAHPS